jgi:hypothetical protein
MSLLKITEFEKKRISDLHKKYQGEVNEKRITLKEGIQIPNEQPINEFSGVGTFFKKLLGGLFTGLKSIFKSTDTKVLNMVSDEMSKVISGLAKSNTKQVSMTAIKSSPGYKKSLSVLVENLSQTKHGLPYERLLQKEKDAIIKEASKGLNQTIITELKSAGKTLAGNIDNLKGAQLVKMGQKTSQITRTINGLSKVKLDKASSLIKSNVKLVGSGKSGAALLSKIKSGKVNVIKGGEVFSASTKSLGNVKVFRLSKDQLKKLALLGVSGLGVLYLIGKMYPNDEVVLQDDGGNDATETDKTGGGSTTRRKYYDCSSVNIETTPLKYGCKDTKIGEIQGCLGLTVDNKFGPNTRKELKNKGHDITNGITKAIYDKVKANCSQTASTQTYADNSAALTSDYMKRYPIKMDLGPVPQMPTKNTSASGASASEGMTDAQYYDSLIRAGLFNATGLIGRTAYNGPALEPSDKQKLDRVLDVMQYDPSNVTATDKGARYVWQKR